MPTVTFAPGVISSPAFIESVIDQMVFSATITSASATLVTWQSGNITFALSGVGFTFGPVLGQTGFTGGVMAGLTVTQAGALQMTVANLGIAATTFQAAVVQEVTLANTAALETLLLGQNWTYTGNANNDVLLSTDTSADGVLLNLIGNDRFNGGGGDDNIFLGDGNDIGHAGTGRDQFFGGLGRDKLYGDSGNDRLFGDDGNDRLFGGVGVDRLAGGNGNDQIDGGAGNDNLAGGAGRDTFVFAPGDGNDTIQDFNIAFDTIDILPGGLPVTSTVGTDTLLQLGGGDQVLLIGISAAEAALIIFI